jgi:hypothetical protein
MTPSHTETPSMASDYAETVLADQRSPIFIGGQHRSGTTLMRVMLHRHPAIACGPESQLLERTQFMAFHQYLIDQWMPIIERMDLDQHDVDHAAATFLDDFFSRFAAQRGKPRWGEKTPKNIFRIDYLFRLFPQAKFVHMIRDPRDIHCSVVEKARTTTKRWSVITPERTAKRWMSIIQHGRPWRCAEDRYLEVRYEDLTDEPVRTMQGVLNFLGETWSDAVIQGRSPSPSTADENVNRTIFRTSVGRWTRDLAEHDRHVIESIAGTVMRESGYEVATATGSSPHAL